MQPLEGRAYKWNTITDILLCLVSAEHVQMSIDGRSREKKIGPSKVYVWKTLEFYMELDTDIVFFFFHSSQTVPHWLRFHQHFYLTELSRGAPDE